jgi:hypothetical protein
MFAPCASPSVPAAGQTVDTGKHQASSGVLESHVDPGSHTMTAPMTVLGMGADHMQRALIKCTSSAS